MSDILLSIIVSACLGALVGLIRQWSDEANARGSGDFVGVRTYSLWAMLGCLAAYLSDKFTPAILIMTFVLVGVQQIIAMSKIPTRHRPGGTTFASVLLTLLVGALVYLDNRQSAVVVAATTMVLLGLKQPLHAWTKRFTSDDISSTLQFVAVTGVILPLVPNRNFGPLDAFNLHEIWLMVVLISGIGFLGYIAIRMLGARAGILVSALLGGLASSTATTLAFSRRSQEQPSLSDECAMAVIVASTVMLGRVAVVIGVLNLELARSLLRPFGLMAVPGILYCIWLWFRRKRDPHTAPTPEIGNPLSLKTALKFGLLYAVIGFLVKAVASHEMLQTSLLPLSFVSGLTDMDAISLNVTRNESSGDMPLKLATQAIVIAAVGNSLLKGGFAVVLGAPALRWGIAITLGFTAGVGIAVCWLV